MSAGDDVAGASERSPLSLADGPTSGIDANPRQPSFVVRMILPTVYRAWLVDLDGTLYRAGSEPRLATSLARTELRGQLPGHWWAAPSACWQQCLW